MISTLSYFYTCSEFRSNVLFYNALFDIESAFAHPELKNDIYELW